MLTKHHAPITALVAGVALTAGVVRFERDTPRFTEPGRTFWARVSSTF